MTDNRIPLSPEFAWTEFASVWGSAYLATDLGERLSCSEVDTLADMFLAHGMPDMCEVWLEAHAVGDECGDQHCRCDRAECIAERNAESAHPMSPTVSESALDPALARLEQGRPVSQFADVDAMFAPEVERLASMGMGAVEVTSTGGNCLAITGDAGVTPDGDAMYLLATTGGPELCDRAEATEWLVGLYEVGGDTVALAFGESKLGNFDTLTDCLERAMTRALTALRSERVQSSYGLARPSTSAIPATGDNGFYWVEGY